jgi:hypothetical protein
MPCVAEYWDDETGGTYGIQWWEGNEILDFTFADLEVDLVRPKGTVVRTKTSNVQGGDGGLFVDEPNVVITWNAGDFTGLSGTYTLQVHEPATGRRTKTYLGLRILTPPH